MLNVAILGYGTVGQGVDEIISKSRSDLKVTRVFDLPTKKDILKERFSSVEEIVADKDIDIVVECMGGDLIPHLAIVSALQNGKHVVTSNKETVSKHLEEYLEAAKKNKVTFQYEASVMGGVPLIAPLTTTSSFDEFISFDGILNGTCNFILSNMDMLGEDYAKILKEAQDKGFAERDPSADVLGIDTKRKIAIIASTCFKEAFDPEEIPCYGIDGITKQMIEDAKKDNKTIRLLGHISKEKDGYSLYVSPALVSKDSFFGGTVMELNGATASFKNNGVLSFKGPGAGRYPTAAAILQDIERIAHGYKMQLEGLEKKANILSNLKGTFVCYEKNSETKVVMSNPNAEELKRFSAVIKEVK